MAQSQYAYKQDIVALSITAAAAVRFGDTAIDAQLKAASGFADSYLASQFILPLQTQPPGWDMSLTQAVCDIAAYKLYTQYGFNPAAPQDQLIVTKYKEALAFLTAIKDKTLFPQYKDSSPTPQGTDEGGPFVISDRPAGFTERGINPNSNWVPSAGSGGFFRGGGE